MHRILESLAMSKTNEAQHEANSLIASTGAEANTDNDIELGEINSNVSYIKYLN